MCSASDSVGVIFTTSYRSMLLITTQTMTLLLVKSSLLGQQLFGDSFVNGNKIELRAKYGHFQLTNIVIQSPVVRNLNNAIHQINHNPVDKC